MEVHAFETALDGYVINDYLELPVVTVEIYELNIEGNEEGEEEESQIDTILHSKVYPVADNAEILLLCAGPNIIALNKEDKILIRKTSATGNPLHFEILRGGIDNARIGHRETRRFADVKALYPRFLS